MKRKKKRDSVELILLYKLEETTDTGKKLRQLLTELGISTRTISEQDLGQTIGYLAQFGGFEASNSAYQGEVPQKPCMVMRGLSSTRMDRLLQLMRQAGIPKIDLKAVVTPVNLPWTFADLMSELGKEHDSIQQVIKKS